MILNPPFVPPMPKNILIDLNVIVDVLLQRKGFKESLIVLELGESGSRRLYISAHMVTTFAYVLEEAKVLRPEIVRHLDWLLRSFTVVPINDDLLKKALKSRIHDYEDAVVEQAAISCSAAAIITRNVKDFKASAIRVVNPEEYVSLKS
jgi:predicted nucleic acid-binding protein